MADFCNRCAPEVWGDDHAPDIDIHQIAESLEPGHFESVLCEGCRLRAIGKMRDGEIMIGILLEEGHVEDMVKWITLETWLTSNTEDLC
jgi:hypothetical protein